MKKLILAVCFLLIFSPTYCFSGEKFNNNSYFDIATGHKYIKIDSSSFAEFSKKGEFLKNVPSTLPLLLKSQKIQPIPMNSYILYEKAFSGASKQKILPTNYSHPKGWKAKRILVALN